MSLEAQSIVVEHPGLWLKRELVDARQANITAIAKHLGMSRPSLVAILEGRMPISAKLAIGFEKAFGLDGARIFQMQKDHEYAAARAMEREIRVRPFDFSAV